MDPLTFQQAKIQYNSDPTWRCVIPSPEYDAVMEIMRKSGAVMLDIKHEPVIPQPVKEYNTDNAKSVCRSHGLSKFSWLCSKNLKSKQ
jgi:hypothetical protein